MALQLGRRPDSEVREAGDESHPVEDKPLMREEVSSEDLEKLPDTRYVATGAGLNEDQLQHLSRSRAVQAQLRESVSRIDISRALNHAYEVP